MQAAKQIPIVLFGTSLWNQIVNFEALVECGVIGANDLSLFYRSDDIDEAYTYIVRYLSSHEQQPGPVL